MNTTTNPLEPLKSESETSVAEKLGLKFGSVNWGAIVPSFIMLDSVATMLYLNQNGFISKKCGKKGRIVCDIASASCVFQRY